MTPLQDLLLRLRALLLALYAVDRRAYDAFLAILTVRVAAENARRLHRERRDG